MLKNFHAMAYISSFMRSGENSGGHGRLGQVANFRLRLSTNQVKVSQNKYVAHIFIRSKT